MPDQLLLVSVGNTRTRFAIVRDGQLEPSRVEPNSDAAALAAAILSASIPSDAGEAAPVLIASVNKAFSEALIGSIKASGRSASRLQGFDASDGVLPIPLAHTLSDPSTVGPDRLLDALGAFSRAKQACVVIDAGTAITVDFIDGQGTFHGGAIAPGVKMMLDSMHAHTAALPQIPSPIPADLLPPTDPTQPPFGASTKPAMVLGALSAARGLVHLLIDRYAEFYEAYPRVIATGGDAALLFENDELVEHIVPDLTLVGMLEAYRRLEQLDDDAAPEAQPHG